MEEREINKILKTNKISLIIALIGLIITIGLLGYAYFAEYQVEQNPLNISELMYNGEEKSGEYVQLDMAYVPYVFAENEGEEDNYYYFAMDKDKYMYIVRLSNETYKSIESLYSEENPIINYHFEGYTFTIDSSIRKLATEAANEIFEETKIDSTNFAEYFGTVYIDEVAKPENDMSNTLIGIAVIAGVFTFIMGIVAISQIVSSNKITKNKELMEDLRNELETMPDNQYKKLKIYLTNKYVIFKAGGLSAIEYKDIIWAYALINYRNGIAISKTLMICTNEKKKYSAATGGADDQNIDEIMVELTDKNPNVHLRIYKGK